MNLHKIVRMLSGKSSMHDKLEFFEKNGYVIFEDSINETFLQNARNDLQSTIKENHDDIKCVRYSAAGKISDFGLEDVFSEFNIVRITNIEQYSSMFRELALSDVICDFLGEYYLKKPTLLQSLTYAFSSHQGEHSDYHLVSPPWAGDYDRPTLAAAWFALEDADAGNGALIIYPGSHKIKKRLLQEFESYGAYVDYLKELMVSHGIEPVTFTAKAGDVLFWHGDFVHAGGIATDRQRSRFSYVCHYARINGKSLPLKSFAAPDAESRTLYHMDNDAKIFL